MRRRQGEHVPDVEVAEERKVRGDRDVSAVERAPEGRAARPFVNQQAHERVDPPRSPRLQLNLAALHDGLVGQPRHARDTPDAREGVRHGRRKLLVTETSARLGRKDVEVATGPCLDAALDSLPRLEATPPRMTAERDRHREDGDDRPRVARLRR